MGSTRYSMPVDSDEGAYIQGLDDGAMGDRVHAALRVLEKAVLVSPPAG